MKTNIEQFAAVCLASANRAAVLRAALVQVRGRLLPNAPLLDGIGDLLRDIDNALAAHDRGNGDGISDVLVCLHDAGEAFVLLKREQFVHDIMNALRRSLEASRVAGDDDGDEPVGHPGW
jgi:hypothetical protein